MTTTAAALSRVRGRLDEAQRQDSSSAAVLESTQATLVGLRSSLAEMNARAAEREQTLSASDQLEAR